MVKKLDSKFINRFEDLKATYMQMKRFGQRSTGIMDLDRKIRETFADDSIGGVFIITYIGGQTTGAKVREDWIYNRWCFQYTGQTYNRAGLSELIAKNGYVQVMIMYAGKSVVVKA